MSYDPKNMDWLDRHDTAMRAPKPGFESGIAQILRGMREYAKAHRAAYGRDGIGTDGALGPCFAEIASGLLGLLNGELGRFDGGELDHEIRKLCSDNDIELE